MTPTSKDTNVIAPAPAVSVIIPSYNAVSFLTETLNSVFAQTFTDYEVILINDGSPETDTLEQILEPYEERIVYLKQENRGAAAARNYGLRVARAPLVAFLDADDIWLPNYLEEQVAFIRRDNFDLVYADALIFGETIFAGKTFMETAPSRGEVTFASLIAGECNVITSGVTARREKIIEVGLFDEQILNSQDFELWVRLVRNGARVAYQRKVLLQYRYRGASLSGDTFNRIHRELQVLELIESTYDLTPDERAKVVNARETVTADLELETGKVHLAKGQYADARLAFKKAAAIPRGLKFKIAHLLLRVSPGLLRRLYTRSSAGIAER